MPNTNIYKHTCDSSDTIDVAAGCHVFGNPAGSAGCLTDFLAQIHPSALEPIPEVPQASETDNGGVKIATQTEINADYDAGLLTDTNAVTPLKLSGWKSSQSSPQESCNQFIRLARCSDVSTGTDDTRAMTPLKMKYWLDNVQVSSESVKGTMRLATQAQAQAGTCNTTVMTPLRTLQAITTFATKKSQASVSTKGSVFIQRGSNSMDTDTTRAITPSKLSTLCASRNLAGPGRIMTSAEANCPRWKKSAFDRVKQPWADFCCHIMLTPGTLACALGNEGRRGFFTVANTLNCSSTTVALSANMGKCLNETKVSLDGSLPITGTLNVNCVESLCHWRRKIWAGYRTGGAHWWWYRIPVFRYEDRVDPVNIISGGQIQKRALSEAHPVGSYYMTTCGINPCSSSMLGYGTWVRESGHTLVGAGGNRDSRGEYYNFDPRVWWTRPRGYYTAYLGISHLPRHQHAGWGERWNTRWPWGYNPVKQYGRNRTGAYAEDHDNYMVRNEPVGGNQGHNNMQPYQVIHMWRRTA